MVNEYQKLACKRLLEKFPELREYISTSSWGAFWEKLGKIDNYIFGEGYEVLAPVRLTNGREVWFSTLFFMALSEAGVPFKMEVLPDAFFEFNPQISRVVLPEGMHNIGHRAFANSSVTEIVIPNTVAVIGGYAFKGCPRLEEIVIPKGVITLGRYMFVDSPIKKIKLPKKFGEMPSDAAALGIKDPSVVEYY